MTRYIIYGCFIGMSIIGCDKPNIRLNDPNDALRPIAEYMQNNYAYSLFSTAIERAGLTEELNSKDTFTVWVPSDEAFNRMGIMRSSDFDRFSIDSLRKLVLRHIQPGIFSSTDIPIGSLGTEYISSSGMVLRFSALTNYYGEVYERNVNGAGIHPTRRDMSMRNGMIHEIDKVLKYSEVSVRTWLEKEGNHSILVAGFKHFGYWDLLVDDREWTILAPTDDVFLSNGITEESISLLDTAVYGKRLLGAYVYPNRFFCSDVGFFLERGFRGIGGTGDWWANIVTPILGDEAFGNALGISYPVLGSGIVGIGIVDFSIISSSSYRGQFIYEVSLPESLYPNRASPLADHLTQNGLVHQIDGLILLPYQAFK